MLKEGQQFRKLVALTEKDEKKQFRAVFGPYTLHHYSLYPTVWGSVQMDVFAHTNSVIHRHEHSCGDGRCLPSKCEVCNAIKCETEMIKGRRGLCHSCLHLMQSITGYHVNECKGCIKVECRICKKVLCVNAFALTFRGKVEEWYAVCRECEHTEHGQELLNHYRSQIEFIRKQERTKRNYRRNREFNLDRKTQAEVLDIFNRKCAACGRTQGNVSLHIDHVVSVVEGGSNSLTNAQVLCGRCNAQKGATTKDYRTEEQKLALLKYTSLLSTLGA